VTAFGVILCLLAAVFAIEAKVAWFSPEGSPRAQISASKLQPADAPRLIAQALDSPAGTPHILPESSLIVALALAVALLVFFPAVKRDRLEPSTSPGFLPPQMFRPPPQY
jgi:hypothetical protein